MSRLDYTAVTSSGRTYEIRFPLHAETLSRERVAELLTRTLNEVNTTTEGTEDISDGDILQALSMAMAVRARMINAPPAVALKLMHELIDSAYAATLQATTFQAARA
jgi:hypothetical protein